MSELDQLRRQLDAVNARIIDLAAERFALIEQVARWKQANSIPIVDQDREAEAKAITEQRAIALGLPRGLAPRSRNS